MELTQVVKRNKFISFLLSTLSSLLFIFVGFVIGKYSSSPFLALSSLSLTICISSCLSLFVRRPKG